MFLNGTNTDTEVFSIDPATGSTSQLAILGPTIRGVEFGISGNLFGLQTTVTGTGSNTFAVVGRESSLGYTGLSLWGDDNCAVVGRESSLGYTYVHATSNPAFAVVGRESSLGYT